ncbi:MAG: hypothetical protein KF715_04075 [Candidatus Didemnitutus sp.]|nr:hypothetical protein [Candidatus Didemnitutus sp.]
MNHAKDNSSRSAPKAGATDTVKPAATWVRGQRAPRRKRTDRASALQLGAINLASNHHA